MMDDRELLTLAARTAGIDDGYDRAWSPLTDDGDAMRLAMKLGMLINIGKWVSTANGKAETVYKHGTIEAATRRAIVRAAADMAVQERLKVCAGN